jgi:hypothetical protein
MAKITTMVSRRGSPVKGAASAQAGPVYRRELQPAWLLLYETGNRNANSICVISSFILKTVCYHKNVIIPIILLELDYNI